MPAPRGANTARAAELYEAAARIRSEDYEIPPLAQQRYQRLGRHAKAMDATSRSAAAAERALALNPHDVRAQSLGFGSLILLSRLEQARDWLQRACALEPVEPKVRYNVACALAVLGEHDRAFDLLEQPSDGERTRIAHVWSTTRGSTLCGVTSGSSSCSSVGNAPDRVDSRAAKDSFIWPTSRNGTGDGYDRVRAVAAASANPRRRRASLSDAPAAPLRRSGGLTMVVVQCRRCRRKRGCRSAVP